MKILLLGEYSRLHNSLKEGLVHLGHEVVIVGDGDGFKNFPVDYSIKPKLLEFPVLNKLKNGIYKFLKIDLTKVEKGLRFYHLLPKLKDFDVVQLINERPIKTTAKFELYLLKKITKQNKKIVLLSCGADTFTAKHMVKQIDDYNILTPYYNNQLLRPHFQYILDYLKPSHQNIHRFLMQHSSAIVASDIDYVLPLKDEPKFKGLIPNPINTSFLNIEIPINKPIKIFLGINKGNYHAKGINYFEDALKILKQTISKDNFEIIVTENIPYKKYQQLINSAHIILDQTYAKDQGYNALEAMAKGQVVFTGAHQEFLNYYDLKADDVCINSTPNAKAIAEKLIYLIKNISELKAISRNAKGFIKAHHSHILVAKKYETIYRD